MKSLSCTSTLIRFRTLSVLPSWKLAATGAPPGYLGGEQWPTALRALRDPRLVELARAYGQDVDSARRSNATSWEHFEERMGYIFCFFRAYQRDPALRGLPPDVPA